MGVNLKYIDEATPFLIDSGLLFEINRQVLHPLGLALAVGFKDGNSSEGSFMLWDCRNEDEGIRYSDDSFEGALKKFNTYMEEQGNETIEKRRKALGYVVQGESPSLREQLDEANKELDELRKRVSELSWAGSEDRIPQHREWR